MNHRANIPAKDGLKAALRAQIHGAPRSIDEMRQVIGLSYSLVSQWGDERHDGCPSLRRFAQLCHVTAPRLDALDYLEALVGRRAYAVPDGSPAASMGSAIRELGEWVTTQAAAVDDGTVTAEEVIRVRREATDAIHAILGAVTQLEGRVLGVGAR